MDELRGPNLQIVLHVKEGLGFGFLSSPFIVSGSVNGYALETDPVIPCHTPSFDTELVWEADKRRFRNLRIQNVPVKIEVYSTFSQGRKTKVGYLLLSLLGAVPCPSNKIVHVKPTWHRLLGVKAEGQCCHPQLLLSLTIEDWTNTPTPRNDMVFHSNEAITNYPAVGSTAASLSFTLGDYIAESKKTVNTPELAPRLLTEMGLIQIGSSPKHLFILSFVLGSVENIDTILPETRNEETDCSVAYTVFTHTVQTDKFSTTSSGVRKTVVHFNQKTNIKLCTDLNSLSRYFSECPHLVTKLRSGDTDIGICCSNLQKLVPTGDLNVFLDSFCNNDRAITFGERCFILPCADGATVDRSRRPYMDMEISLKYVRNHKENSPQLLEIARHNAPGTEMRRSRSSRRTVCQECHTVFHWRERCRRECIPQKPNQLTVRSASHLGCKSGKQEEDSGLTLQRHKSTSCTEMDRDGDVNTARKYSRHNSFDTATKSQNEIADMIRKMYEQFTISQEILSARTQPTTKEIDGISHSPMKQTISNQTPSMNMEQKLSESSPMKQHPDENDLTPAKRTLEKNDERASLLSPEEKERLMKKCVEELEDWKEKQQEIFKYQLKQKEEYHLKLLSDEWNKRRSELEGRLNRGIEQCRSLASDLGEATNNFRLRSCTLADREKKAKQTLEHHYARKFQDLREASQKMEADMAHRVKLKDMRIEELETELEQSKNENHIIKTNVKNIEKEVLAKNSRITKDQTAGLIQELRNLKGQLDEALQSKAFFKEQWGRAVREMHSHKLQSRRQMLSQLQQERRHIGDLGLDNIAEGLSKSKMEIPRLKDDVYINLMADSPTLADTLSQSTWHMAPVSHTGFFMEIATLAHARLSQRSNPTEHSSNDDALTEIRTFSGAANTMSADDSILFIDTIESLRESLKIPNKSVNEKLNYLMEERDRLIQKENPDEEKLMKLNHEIRNILLKL